MGVLEWLGLIAAVYVTGAAGERLAESRLVQSRRGAIAVAGGVVGGPGAYLMLLLSGNLIVGVVVVCLGIMTMVIAAAAGPGDLGGRGDGGDLGGWGGGGDGGGGAG